MIHTGTLKDKGQTPDKGGYQQNKIGAKISFNTQENILLRLFYYYF